ncbi:hypothetical protein BJ322DRAFT_1061089 [Thelephora terrestris]|uniref:Uncharacterized protein n=1 Tax=Thelephora terrestris TaxID=56493 RepID=A0A9P6HE35_9AGAM|nr:hypothetical protein BJ322DRAFT_1061089 [Thelephora terrestris]
MVSSSTSAVRKTYTTRRQSAIRDVIQNDSSAEESDVGSRQSSPRKQVSPSKRSENRPKRVDVFLPPPSPKRSRFAAVDGPDTELNAKPISKTAQTSPVQANKGNTPKRTSTVPTPMLLTKASLNSLNKSKRASSPVEAADDNESIAESATTGAIRRTEEQRIQYLREQPDCGELEPHRAFCKRCNRWVGMGGKTTYPLYKWAKHAEKCKTKEPAGSDGGESGDDQPSVAGTPDRAPRRNEEQRREFLNKDPRVLVAKEWEVQCRACQKWIKLGNQRKYDLTPWNQHCGRCSGELPSGRVATMNRKMQLVNDSQVKSFTAEAVVCNVCHLPVVLQGDGDYSLVKWHEHKLTCIPPTPPPISIPSTSVAGTVPKPPASNPDTEATLVGATSSPSRGKKRQREGGEDVEDPTGATTEDLDVRPTVKRRTESYQPPQGFLPSLWRWATTEVKAFVRAAFGGAEGKNEEAGEGSAAAQERS